MKHPDNNGGIHGMEEGSAQKSPPGNGRDGPTKIGFVLIGGKGGGCTPHPPPFAAWTNDVAPLRLLATMVSHDSFHSAWISPSRLPATRRGDYAREFNYLGGDRSLSSPIVTHGAQKVVWTEQRERVRPSC